MYKKKNILAIIPARGGSKGIHQKNIKKINGVPIVCLAGLCAKNISQIDRVIISTDCEKIISVSKQYGLDVPFKRPKKWSTDKASQLDVIKHTIKFLEKSEEYFPDIITVLHPTNPFVTSKNLDKSIRKLKRTKADLVLGVMPVKTHPFRSFWYRSQFLEKFSKDFDKYYQRQTFPKLYSPTGDIYTFRYKSFKIQRQ